MDSSTQQAYGSHTAYSLNDILRQIKSHLEEYRRHIRIIFAFLFLGLVFGIYHKWTTPRIYEAETSFMINEEQAGFGSVSGMLGQFGGLLGGEQQVNLQKILELAKTRRIAEGIFFQRCRLPEGGEELLANWLIREFEQHGKWGNSPFYKPAHPLKQFRFTQTDPKKFSRLENMALLQIHQLFQGMLTTSVSEKTNIMHLSVMSTNESLAFEAARRLFEELSNYYIDQTVEKQRDTYNGLNHKTDSLRALIESKHYGLAGIRDSYRGSGWLFREEVPKTLLDQDIKALQLVYAEALKNKEIASFALTNRTPFIQPIDLPIQPLKSTHAGWLKSILMGLCYGLFFSLLWISLRKFAREHITTI